MTVSQTKTDHPPCKPELFVHFTSSQLKVCNLHVIWALHTGLWIQIRWGSGSGSSESSFSSRVEKIQTNIFLKKAQNYV